MSATFEQTPNDTGNSEIYKLHTNCLPQIMEITDVQALAYVTELLETLLKIEQPLIPQSTPQEGKERRPSYEQAVETNRKVLTELIPNRHYKNTIAISDDDSDESDFQKAFELYKRFWLKEVPPISVKDYLLRFHRYCKSSPATYLMAGCLVYYVAVEKQAIPITERNIYRIFCAAFMVAAKFIEDELYSMSRYATTAGLKKPDLGRLEISFLLLINFNIHSDKEYLKEELRKWATLSESLGQS